MTAAVLLSAQYRHKCCHEKVGTELGDRINKRTTRSHCDAKPGGRGPHDEIKIKS